MVMGDEQLLAAIAARGEGGDEKSRSGRSLLITGALFLALGGFYWGWEWVALITVAIDGLVSSPARTLSAQRRRQGSGVGRVSQNPALVSP